ncbi:MAG TPA: lysophospholipid acyltransferase family protein [Candidatus Humimicrobiaceae bacterium]|nr:lysophospholipid acyltransferase family protein [Candidatus Humimicrobiaceae bacterium]
MNPVISWFCKIFLKPIVGRLLIKEVRGLGNIPMAPFILVSNHVSYLDIIIDSYLCVPRKFHFIGQIDGFKGVIKWLIRAIYFISGVIPLDRKNDRSRENVLKQAIQVLKKGNILVLYPEGRRSTNGEIQKGRFGTAKIFLKTGVSVIAAGIKGTFESMPPKGKLKIKKIIEVSVSKPLFFNEEFNLAQNLAEDSLEYQQVLEKITDKIIGELKQLAT